MNKFYVASKENFAKAILDPNYMLDVLLIRDGRPIPTTLIGPIKTTNRIATTSDQFEVTLDANDHILTIHLI